MKQILHIAIVIVNWNGKTDTLTCLASLRKMKHQSHKLSIIVVDNGSSDDSIEVIRSEYPEVIVIPTGKNLGFTGGNNVGIKKALVLGADYIWLLNNDTLVDPNALSFIDVFKDSAIGLCGSKIYFAPGHEYHAHRYSKGEQGKVFWYAGGLVDWDNMYASHRGVDEVDHGQYDTVIETQFVTGCSFIVKREVVEKTGMLDDKYYLYLEDLDWSLRIQKAGWKTVYAPTSVIWHVNAGSSGKPGNPLHEYYFTRNRLLLGFRYAKLRTKFALLREAIRFILGPSPIRRNAVVDWMLGRFGKQYEPKKLT